MSRGWKERVARAAQEVEGSALLEFALVLPLLVVFLVGIYDFSGAFNLKQKIAHAAQEGAILAGALPMSDIAASNGNPDSLRPVVIAIINSLAVNNVLPVSSCLSAANADTHSGLTWTYIIQQCSSDSRNPLTITINRGNVQAVSSSPSPLNMVTTVVTVQYPYQWRFNSVIQLLVPGASYTPTTLVTETATVHNQM